jgi:2-dehydro-3-deoxyglucarate aldolase/4-hydroxy-2-oxoheptanedioate aldolase
MPATFKQLLAADQVIPVFSVARIAHPIVIEMFALAGGYRGFWLDLEHGAMVQEQLVSAALAARANGMDFFVRMPPIGYWKVTQSMEAGAGGVMGAQIQSAEHARQFVSWTKFAPRGTRGLVSTGREAHYTHTPVSQVVEAANRDRFVAIQIETLGALDEADEIASLEGVDLLFVGPADLSLVLGVVGQFHHERLWEAIARVAAACRRHGKAWGAVVPDPEFARRAAELGCRMPTIGNEILALRRGIEILQQAFGDQFAKS